MAGQRRRAQSLPIIRRGDSDVNLSPDFRRGSISEQNGFGNSSGSEIRVSAFSHPFPLEIQVLFAPILTCDVFLIKKIGCSLSILIWVISDFWVLHELVGAEQ